MLQAALASSTVVACAAQPPVRIAGTIADPREDAAHHVLATPGWFAFAG
jgi:hypothetical protein